MSVASIPRAPSHSMVHDIPSCIVSAPSLLVSGGMLIFLLVILLERIRSVQAMGRHWLCVLRVIPAPWGLLSCLSRCCTIFYKE